jgi:CRISPR/Cas system-associated endonuclease Cas1
MEGNWFGHILRRNYLLKQFIEGKINREMEVTKRRGRRRKKLLDDLEDRRRILSFEGESSRSHYMEKSLWRRLWTCRQTEY